MDREAALNFLHKHLKNQNLRRHCYAVEAVMEVLAIYFCETEKLAEKEKTCTELAEMWGIAGLVHDADYEETKDSMKKKHSQLVTKWLKEKDVDASIIQAVGSHAWNYVKDAAKPQTKMDWSLYCCDELTGLIVAVTLVRPDKKLSSVTVESVKNKWNSKSFAAGVDRKQIEICEEKLNIPLDEFIGMALKAMQDIHQDLGL